MFGCFRKGEANDPETYTAAVSAVLSLYSPEIVHRITDPRTGLAGRSKFLPTVSEVREACEEEAQREARLIQHQSQIARQLAERKRDEEERANIPRPSYEELKAKYGPEWGLMTEKKDDKAQQTRRDSQVRANQSYFEKQCEKAGVDPAGGVSPDLIKWAQRDKATHPLNDHLREDQE